MTHKTYENIADEILYGGWGIESEIHTLSFDANQTALLVHIARSLSLLRCENLKAIPRRLKNIEAHLRHLSEKKRKGGKRS